MGNKINGIRVTDIVGNDVYSKYDPKISQADLSILPNGIYFLNVICNGGNKVFKIVKN
jgi:hypothetical protein